MFGPVNSLETKYPKSDVAVDTSSAREDKGVINKAELAKVGAGSTEFRDLNWKIKDLLSLTASEFLRRATRGDDRLIGSSKNDSLFGEKGDDIIYGGRGNDLVVGGGGRNQAWGQGGRDTFRLKRGNGYTIVKDFTDGEDRIHLASGRSGLRLNTRDDDVYIFQRKDLLGVIQDAAGDLRVTGEYLV